MTKYTISYRHRNNTELANFCINRGLKVNSTAKDDWRPPRRADYFEALRLADDNFTFRFFDLPPELRNRVYEELLVLRDSYTCFPQILAVSQQVHHEAVNILYGDNLIEIKIADDGVYVHGTNCGGPQYWNSSPVDESYWPAMIYKAHFLRVSVLGSELRDKLTDHNSFLRSRAETLVQKVICSLCLALKRNKSLRSLRVDLAGLLRDDRDVWTRLNYLLLLGHAKELAIEVGDQHAPTSLYADVQAPVQIHRKWQPHVTIFISRLLPKIQFASLLAIDEREEVTSAATSIVHQLVSDMPDQESDTSESFVAVRARDWVTLMAFALRYMIATPPPRSNLRLRQSMMALLRLDVNWAAMA